MEKKKKVLLIVDDDRELAKGFISLLGEEGFEVKAEYDGKAALEHAKNNRIDCMIVDALLPKMDGFRLCEELRWADETRKIPIIMISGVYRAVNHGSDSISKYKLADYFEKPIAPSTVIESLRNIFGEEYPLPAPIQLGTSAYGENITMQGKSQFYDDRNIFYMLNPSDMPLNGDLGEMPFSILLWRLCVKKATGALMITMGKARKIITIDNGRPVAVSSNIIGECLSQIMVKQGALTQDQFEDIHAEFQKTKKKHGEILIERGIIGNIELAQWLRRQAEYKLYSVFNWREARFSFKAIENLTRQTSNFTLHPYVIIKNGLMNNTNEDRLDDFLQHYLSSNAGAVKETEEIMREAAFGLKDIRWVQNKNSKEDLQSLMTDPIYQGLLMKGFLMCLISIGALKLQPPKLEDIKEARGIEELGDLGEHQESVLQATARAHLNGKAITIKDMARQTGEISIEEMDRLDYERSTQNMSEEEKQYYTKLFNWRRELRGKNHFEALKLEETSAPEETKKAFTKLAKECHPDAQPSENKEVRLLADEIFTILSKAHETLSDKQKRRKYVDAMKNGGEGDATNEVAKIMAADNLFREGLTFMRRKDFLGAKQKFQEALKLNDAEGEYIISMGWAHFNIAPMDILNRQEAIKMIESGLERIPKYADGYFYKGSIFKAMGDQQQAYEWYQKTLEIDRKHARALSELRLMKMRVETERDKKKGLFSKLLKR